MEIVFSNLEAFGRAKKHEFEKRWRLRIIHVPRSVSVSTKCHRIIKKKPVYEAKEI